MNIITASSIPTAMICMRAGAARAFGARGKMQSDLKESLPAYLFEGTYKHSIKAAMGTAVHNGAEIILKEKRDTLELAPISVMKDATQWSLAEATKEGIEYDTEFSRFEAAERTALGMAGVWYNVAPKLIQPREVEIRLEAKISDQWTLSGQLDVLDIEGRILEHKFGKAGSPLGYIPQIGAQSLLVRANKMLENGVAEIGTLPRSINVKAEDYEIERFEATQARELALKWIKKIIEQSDKYMADGNPEHFDASPGCFLCSAKYCRAFGTKFCKYTMR